MNKLPPVLTKHYTQKTIFLCPGVQPPRKGVKTNSRPEQLEAARDWKILADLDQRLIFPPEIATTNLRPDIVLWSGSARVVQLIELTVPWEDAVDEAYERKNCNMLIWPLKQNSEDGESRFIQWKWVVKVLWHTLQQWPRVASHSKELI